MNIGIINAGVGSIHSLQNSLRLLGYSATVVSDLSKLSNFSRLIFPGVGHFDQGSSFVSDILLKQSLLQFLDDPDKRLLGICLGMQLLFSSSEESVSGMTGLSLFDFPIQRLPASEAKVPNLGWLPIHVEKESKHFVDQGIHGRDFYFVHSYALLSATLPNPNSFFHEYAIANHGRTQFVAMFRSSNVYGCQFHPEKSSLDGLSILKKFLE